MADVAMAMWGKDAGGRMAVAHLVFVCCVGAQKPLKNVPSHLEMLLSYVDVYLL